VVLVVLTTRTMIRWRLVFLCIPPFGPIAVLATAIVANPLVSRVVVLATSIAKIVDMNGRAATPGKGGCRQAGGAAREASLQKG
jgi:hypothetical protein